MNKQALNYIYLPVRFPLQKNSVLTSAVRVAIVNQLALKLLYVLPVSGGLLDSNLGVTPYGSPADIGLEGEAREKSLQRFCQQIKSENPLLLDCEYETRTGFLEPELLRIIEEDQPAWTFVSKPADTTTIEKLMGTLATHLAKNATSPVMVLPEEGLPLRPGHITYLTEVSEEDHEGFLAVDRLAKGFRSTLVVVEIGYRKVNKRVQFKRERYLKETLGNDNLIFIMDNRSDLASTLETILNQGSTEMVVMNHRQQNFFTRLFFGDTTKQMVLEAEKPLVVL